MASHVLQSQEVELREGMWKVQKAEKAKKLDFASIEGHNATGQRTWKLIIEIDLY